MLELSAHGTCICFSSAANQAEECCLYPLCSKVKSLRKNQRDDIKSLYVKQIKLKEKRTDVVGISSLEVDEVLLEINTTTEEQVVLPAPLVAIVDVIHRLTTSMLPDCRDIGEEEALGVGDTQACQGVQQACAVLQERS